MEGLGGCCDEIGCDEIGVPSPVAAAAVSGNGMREGVFVGLRGTPGPRVDSIPRPPLDAPAEPPPPPPPPPIPAPPLFIALGLGVVRVMTGVGRTGVGMTG